jgi:hypothetical protein
MKHFLPLLAGVIIAAAGIAHPAEAQTVPFGKNKIQYRQFDWKVISGEHVDVYFYPEADELARLTLAYAEESFRILERKFQHHPFRRIPLIVYSSDKHFSQTNVIGGFIPEGVLGFTEYLKRRVALPFRGDYAQFRQTLRHELIHAFQLSKLAEVHALHPRQRRFTPQQIHWWTEGLAEYWSGDQDTDDDMYIRDLVLTGRLPDIRQFSYTYSFYSYPLGGELHKYLSGRFGESYIARMYEEYWKYDSFEDALAAILGVDLERLSREWRYELEQRYFPIYAERPPLEVGAHPVIHRGNANFKPVLYTPPGDSIPYILFLSPRTGYTNLYRARLDRGEADVQVVVEGERSPEFESLHAYESRIDVSHAGVVAFISRYQDRDALFLWDLDRRRVVGRYQWPDLVGLLSPAWDPEGRKVVFEGLSTSGYSDLYVVDFATQQRTALTNDRYRDAQPDWSPDGQSIVFASDRTAFGADGHTNLFIYDLAARDIRPLTYGRWHDRDPRWSGDGTRIVFSSDRSGIYDLYQVDRQGSGHRLTTMAGGAFDPEWLPGDDGLVFVGFSESRYRIYRKHFTTDSAELPPIALADPGPDWAGTDPMTLAAGEMSWDWAELEADLLDDVDPEPYRRWREFSLDFAGGDAIVAPGYGSAQGAQFLASDMLGDHLLFLGITAVQAQGLSEFLDNFSGQLLYLNLAHRLNWGAGLFRYKGRFYDVSLDVYREETFGGYFVASYPFSKFNRVELSLGLERSRRIDEEDPWEAGFFGPDTRPDPRDLTRSGLLTTNYLSYVKDNTLWLPTGPIDGERYNVTAGLVTCFVCTTRSTVSDDEVSRGAAAENFVLFGDYRRYVRTSLLTAYAVRAYAFYSDGAIPARAILGGPGRLRGYPRFSLTGSRLWLLNQEWRFPILHSVGLAFPFGELRLPGVQGAFFTDVGSSWLEHQRGPDGTWGSYGVGFRSSFGPPLVLRLDIGRRFRIGSPPPVLFRGDRRFNDTFVDLFFGFNY